MTPNVNVGLVRAAAWEIIGEANWLIKELSQLEQEDQDDGQGPAIRKLCETLVTTTQYDVRSEIDLLADRIDGSGSGDPRAPASLLLKWLREDIEPLARLAQTRMNNGQASPLAMLLMTGSGEIVNRFLAIEDELKQLMPLPTAS